MTYSIVARDPDTGELGVAVQSHWFSVGPVVPWARPGVGAIATQAMARVQYGPEGLELLAAGVGAEQALSQLLAKDEGSGWRQVAVIDASGAVCTHTGTDCIPFAGHAVGEQVSCQANIMARETVWDAMLTTFQSSSGPLAERLLAALDAAEAEGGDLRGRQSAALLVVPGTGEWWETTVSLRVEDDPEPLRELRRLLRLHSAYQLAGEADDLVTEGRRADGARRYQEAATLEPDSHELLFWSGIGMVEAGNEQDGIALVRRAIELQPSWAELLPRMPAQRSPGLTVVSDALGLS